MRPTSDAALTTTSAGPVSDIADATVLTAATDVVTARECSSAPVAGLLATALTTTLAALLSLTALLAVLRRLLTTAVASLAGLIATLCLAVLLALLVAIPLPAAAVLSALVPIQRAALPGSLHRLQLAAKTLHLSQRCYLVWLALVCTRAARERALADGTLSGTQLLAELRQSVCNVLLGAVGVGIDAAA